MNNWDSYLIKTDSLGSLLWSKTYGDSGGEQSYDMDLSSDSGCIMIGVTSSFGLGYNDCYMIKTDFLGNSGGCYENIQQRKVIQLVYCQIICLSRFLMRVINFLLGCLHHPLVMLV